MYSSMGVSVGEIHGEGDISRQQRLDKQRALLEQKKRQRQMQHGMVVAGGGRPVSSKAHRSRTSTGSSAQSMETANMSMLKSPNFNTTIDPSPAGNISTARNPLNISSTNAIKASEVITRGDSTSGSSMSHSNEPRKSISSSDDDNPPVYPSKPKMQPSQSSMAPSNSSKSYDAFKAAPQGPGKEDSAQKTSAAAKLQALGIASSLDYDSESDSDIEVEEIDSGTIFVNPGARKEDDRSRVVPEASSTPSKTEPISNQEVVVVPQPGKPDTTPNQDLKKLGITLSSEGDKIENLMEFVKKPAPDGVTVKCRVQRQKRGMERSMFPTYYLFLDRGETVRMLFVLAARKRKKSRSSNYLVSTSAKDLSRDGKNFVGKLRANFLGTSFTVYDDGVNPSSRKLHVDKSNLRQELAAVHYETNVLGFKGPRKMTTIIPALNYKHECIAVQPTSDSETLLERWKSSSMTDLLQLHNKQPVWSDETQAFVLNFHGRVTQASVKNFQLVHSADEDYIVLQFGRISEDLFTLDYKFPLTALQAFSIALSSFDSKLACE